MGNDGQRSSSSQAGEADRAEGPCVSTEPAAIAGSHATKSVFQYLSDRSSFFYMVDKLHVGLSPLLLFQYSLSFLQDGSSIPQALQFIEKSIQDPWAREMYI